MADGRYADLYWPCCFWVTASGAALDMVTHVTSSVWVRINKVLPVRVVGCVIAVAIAVSACQHSPQVSAQPDVVAPGDAVASGAPTSVQPTSTDVTPLNMKVVHAEDAVDPFNCQFLPADAVKTFTQQQGTFVPMEHMRQQGLHQPHQVVQHCYYDTGAQHGHVSYTIRYFPDQLAVTALAASAAAVPEEEGATTFEAAIGELAVGLQVTSHQRWYHKLDVAAGLYQITVSSRNPDPQAGKAELVRIAEHIYGQAAR